MLFCYPSTLYIRLFYSEQLIVIASMYSFDCFHLEQCRWVEFSDKRVAKRTANMLNGEQIGTYSDQIILLYSYIFFPFLLQLVVCICS